VTFRKKPLALHPGKTKNHAAGSLELIVENLVKTWEMATWELSHFFGGNEKRTRWLFRVHRGNPTQLCGDDFINP